jgi:hypothetical protein
LSSLERSFPRNIVDDFESYAPAYDIFLEPEWHPDVGGQTFTAQAFVGRNCGQKAGAAGGTMYILPEGRSPVKGDWIEFYAAYAGATFISVSLYGTGFYPGGSLTAGVMLNSGGGGQIQAVHPPTGGWVNVVPCVANTWYKIRMVIVSYDLIDLYIDDIFYDNNGTHYKIYNANKIFEFYFGTGATAYIDDLAFSRSRSELGSGRPRNSRT